MKRRAFLSRLAGLPILGRLIPKLAAAQEAAVPITVATTGSGTRHAFSVVIFPVIGEEMPDIKLEELLPMQPMTAVSGDSIPLLYSASFREGQWHVVNNLKANAGVVKRESADPTGREPVSLGSASLPAGTIS